MSITDPVPPVPQHSPPLEHRSGLDRFTNNWMQWFLQLREKINVINESLVSLGLVTDPGLLAKQADGSWAVRTISGTTGRITVADGDGADNPTIDFENEGIQDLVAAMLVEGSNITLTYNDATGTITIASSGGGAGGDGWTTVEKLVTETRASTTILADDTDLLFGADASSKYIAQVKVYFLTANATMDYKIAPAYTGTIIGTPVHHRGFTNPGASASFDNLWQGVIGAVINQQTNTAATTSGYAVYESEIIFETDTAGNFSIQWAQNTSDPANLSVLFGSYIRYRKLGS